LTDREFKAQCRRLRRLEKRWTAALGLQRWRIQSHYHRDDQWFHDWDADDPVPAGLTRTRWEYREATIHWHMPAIAEWNDDDLENVVVHELMHIMIQTVVDGLVEGGEVTEIGRRHIELAATELARAFVWVRDDAIKGKV
jgi:hypothetical protein